MPDRFSLLSGSDPMNPHFKTLPAAMCLGPGYARLWPGASSLRQFIPPPQETLRQPGQTCLPFLLFAPTLPASVPLHTQSLLPFFYTAHVCLPGIHEGLPLIFPAGSNVLLLGIVFRLLCSLSENHCRENSLHINGFFFCFSFSSQN